MVPTVCPLTPMAKLPATLASLPLPPSALAPLRPRVRAGGRKSHPAEALVVGVLGGGVQPGCGGRMRHFLEEPVLVVVALADGIGDVVREEAGVTQTPAPQPVVVAEIGRAH